MTHEKERGGRPRPRETREAGECPRGHGSRDGFLGRECGWCRICVGDLLIVAG